MNRIIAFILGLILLPVLVTTALLVRIFLGSPILFRQERPGLDGKPFFLLKFRSMKNGKKKSGELLPDQKRMSRFGDLIRKLSLDEPPQLWNIIKGDMNFIGPRPLLMEYLPLYSNEQTRRHNLKPGITGWAQVNGRNAISWDEKFKLDVWYVENQSLWLDVKILFLTLKNVLLRYGVSPYNKEFMPRFDRRDE